MAAGCQGAAKSIVIPQAPHEASLLHLLIDKAHHQLGLAPRWDVATTVERTVRCSRQVEQGEASALACCLADLAMFAAATGR